MHKLSFTKTIMRCPVSGPAMATSAVRRELPGRTA